MTRRKDIRGGLVAALVCTLALAGCGSDEEKGKGIPQQTAQALEQQLQSIESRIDADACQDVTEGDETNVRSVRETIDQLPSDTDQEVRDALEQSFARLFELVREDCRPRTDTQTETTPTQTIPPPTETQTTPTETTPTQTETTPTTPTNPSGKPKKPKSPGGGQGNGGQQSPQTGGGVQAPDG